MKISGLPREETIDRIAKAAKDLELADYLNRSIFALSSGEKQQIAVGSVYALSPKVYIFDEPSANLDYAATKRLAEIMGKLKRDGYTIFVVEHRFYYLRDLIDRVFLIQNGKSNRNLQGSSSVPYRRKRAYPMGCGLHIRSGMQSIIRRKNAAPWGNTCCVCRVFPLLIRKSRRSFGMSALKPTLEM